LYRFQELRLPVGGPDVMKDQYLHLLGMAQRSYLTVRVVPTTHLPVSAKAWSAFLGLGPVSKLAATARAESALVGMSMIRNE
jgi:hypothetical protein